MDIRAILTLLSVPGVGPVNGRKLIEHFGSAEKVLSAGVDTISRVEGFGEKRAKGFEQVSYDFADKQLEAVGKHSGKIVSLWDEDYPKLLKEIYDPPLILFYEGNLDALKGDCFAIVGTRTPSPYGKILTKEISAGLAGKGFCIVSGMARGIDTEAHRGAMNAGGVTAAVLGCGLDVVYPRENSKLKKDIVEKGVVITEYPYGTPPDGGNFPRRNRIISGLSVGILTAEAGLKSGALITAAYAADQNREVFALPGDVNRISSQGCNRLIRNQTALLISGPEDILESLGRGGKPNTALFKEEPALKGIQLAIYKCLSGEPIYIDNIAMQISMNTSETLTALLEMEMDDLVKSLPGKYYTLK